MDGEAGTFNFGIFSELNELLNFLCGYRNIKGKGITKRFEFATPSKAGFAGRLKSGAAHLCRYTP